VRVDGRTGDGYQVYLGADLDDHEIGTVVGRVADADVDAAVTAIVGTWEALRHPGESLGRTVRRFTPEAFSLQIQAALAERWAPGPEPADAPVLAR
jgi:sulfite reductase beta subunit-like hemoprotein